MVAPTHHWFQIRRPCGGRDNFRISLLQSFRDQYVFMLIHVIWFSFLIGILWSTVSCCYQLLRFKAYCALLERGHPLKNNPQLLCFKAYTLYALCLSSCALLEREAFTWERGRWPPPCQPSAGHIRPASLQSPSSCALHRGTCRRTQTSSDPVGVRVCHAQMYVCII